MWEMGEEGREHREISMGNSTHGAAPTLHTGWPAMANNHETTT